MYSKIFPTSYGEIHVNIFGKTIWDDFEQSKDFEKIRSVIVENLQFNKRQIFSVKQTHSDIVLPVSGLDYDREIEGDGLYSEVANQLLFIKTADCLPLFFWSDTFPVYGAIHVGWRGLRSRIVQKFFLNYFKEYPHITDWNFLVGPCISKKKYRIGEEVAIFFKDSLNSLIQFEDGFYFGIKDYLLEKLNELPFSFKLTDSGICTFDELNYFSHRRNESGRNLNMIRCIS